MKTLLSVFLILLLSQSVNSQFVINSSFNPVPGDVNIIRFADTTGIQPGPSGANQTWNFTNLIPLPDSTITTYYVPSSTPYGSSFPSATVASADQSMSTYSYYNTSSSIFEGIGYAYNLGEENYSNSEIILQYPLSYGQSFSDSFSATGTYSIYTMHTSGTMTTNCDAYGTIILPSGSSNAMRIKTLLITYDTIFYNGVPIGTDYSIDTNYSWIKSNYKFPIFYIDFIYSSSCVYTKKTVGFKSNSATIGIKQVSSSVPSGFKLLQNYPNPFNPSTSIKYYLPENTFVSLNVYDILGREVMALVSQKQSPGIYEINFNADNLSSGVYIYKLQAGKFGETRKMILKK